MTTESTDPDALAIRCDEHKDVRACLKLADHPKESRRTSRSMALVLPCDLGVGDSCRRLFELQRKQDSQWSSPQLTAILACARHGQLCDSLKQLYESNPDDGFLKSSVFLSNAGPTENWTSGPVYHPSMKVPEDLVSQRDACGGGMTAACAAIGMSAKVLPYPRAVALDLACKGNHPSACAASVDAYLELDSAFYAHQVAGRTCLLRGELCDRVRALAKAKPERADLAEWVRKLDAAGK